MLRILFSCLSGATCLAASAPSMMVAAASPTDRGCCVFWQDISRNSVRSSVEDTREQCSATVRGTGTDSKMWDFFVNRNCAQAERCKDAACANLEGEAVAPLTGN